MSEGGVYPLPLLLPNSESGKGRRFLLRRSLLVAFGCCLWYNIYVRLRQTYTILQPVVARSFDYE